MKQEFLLDPNIIYLNHGSYGATPRGLLQHQRDWQDQMEREPVQFMSFPLPQELQKSRQAAATFLKVTTKTISCVTNATYGVHTILSQRIRPKKKIVCTNHRYQAVYNTLHFLCEQQQAELVEITLPFGQFTPHQLLEFLWESIPADADLVVLDEISSATAMRFPVNELSKRIKERNPNTEILVDGAHSPGQIDTNFAHIDYWTGNLHKWCCAPKGCALLYIDEEKQHQMHAPVISHGYKEGFQQEIGWMGTHDPTPFLCIPEVIRQHQRWGGKGFRQKNHQLMLEAREYIHAVFPYFLTDDSIDGLAICSFLIPFTENIHQILFSKYNIEAFVNPFGTYTALRISCFSAYNSMDDYHKLVHALKDIGY